MSRNKHIKQTILVFSLIIVSLTMLAPFITAPVMAQDGGLFPLPPVSEYEGSIAVPEGGTAQEQVSSLIGGIVNNIRYIIGAIAIGMLVYAGAGMVISWGKEEDLGTYKDTILYAVIGLAVVGLSGEISRILSVESGTFLKDPDQIVRTTVLFNQQTKIVITFIKYIIGSIAVFQIVRSGLKMVTVGGDEEVITKEKKYLAWAALGLIMIIFADTAINQVFYKVDTSAYPSTGGAAIGVDAARGVEEIVGATNFIVSIVGPLAVLALLGGGVMYMTSAGNDERLQTAKKIIIAAIIGIIVIFGAFAAVSTFIGGQFQ